MTQEEKVIRRIKEAIHLVLEATHKEETAKLAVRTIEIVA
jgi:predicted RNase H-like HicB family nuclease